MSTSAGVYSAPVESSSEGDDVPPSRESLSRSMNAMLWRVESLLSGTESLEQHESQSAEGVPIQVTEFISDVVSTTAFHRGKHTHGVDISVVFEQIKRCLDKLRSLADWHSDASDYVLLCEFVTGLCIFEQCALLCHHFAAAYTLLGKLEAPSFHAWTTETESFVAGLDAAMTCHAVYQAWLRRAYQEGRFASTDRLWGLFSQHWTIVFQPLGGDAVLEQVVSLRYIPRQVDVILRAQSLHWMGWGGTGAVFACDPDASAGVSSLMKVMHKHSALAINYYAQSDSPCAQPPSFAAQLHRALQQCSDTGLASSVGVNFGSHAWPMALVIQPFNQGVADTVGRILGAVWDRDTELEVCGDAVGPGADQELRFLASWITHSGSRAGVKLHVSEGTSAALVHLEAMASSTKHEEAMSSSPKHEEDQGDINIIVNVQHRDLNQVAEPQQCSHAHVYSCCIALHQVADMHGRGLGRIQAVYRYATAMLQPRGLVVHPDAGADIALQVFTIPINLVDREGGWNGDFFTRPRPSSPCLRFRDVAVPVPGSPVVYKVPVPMHWLALYAPRRDSALYAFVPCMVLLLSEADIDQVQSVWEQDSADSPSAAAKQASFARAARASWGRQGLDPQTLSELLSLKI